MQLNITTGAELSKSRGRSQCGSAVICPGDSWSSSFLDGEHRPSFAQAANTLIFRLICVVANAIAPITLMDLFFGASYH